MVRGVLVNHKLAGVMESMFHIDIDSRNAEIGYWLGQQYWGQGNRYTYSTDFVRRCFPPTLRFGGFLQAFWPPIQRPCA